MKPKSEYSNKIFNAVDKSRGLKGMFKGIDKIVEEIRSDVVKKCIDIIIDEAPQYFYGKKTMMDNIFKLKFPKEKK
jgi:hypothetical protein